MKKKEIDGIMENKTLLNILSPIGGIEYKKNYIRVGDYLGRVYVITKYPQKVRVGWLENIANIPNTVCCLNISPTEKDTLMQNISRGIKQNESQYEGTTDEILRQRTEEEKKMLYNYEVIQMEQDERKVAEALIGLCVSQEQMQTYLDRYDENSELLEKTPEINNGLKCKINKNKIGTKIIPKINGVDLEKVSRVVDEKLAEINGREGKV